MTTTLTMHEPFMEVITGLTPLECGLLNEHPRLHLSTAQLAHLRDHLAEQSYGAMLDRVRAHADAALSRGCPNAEAAARQDIRGIGEDIGFLSLTYLLTGEPRYLGAAQEFMLACAGYPDAIWEAALVGGHLLYGSAIGYDWLYSDLDEDARTAIRESLQRHGQHMFMEFATHANWAVDSYCCNHIAVTLGGLTAAAVALYGEVPGIGQWLKLILEKMLVISAALGEDGVSQEGITYGEYYADYFIKAVDLVQQSLGVDFFTRCPWLRHTGAFYLYSAVPRQVWNRQSCLINYGDGVRYHWYGPSHMLRRLAGAYRDGHAQWLADITDADDIGRPGYLGLLWYDPSVPAQSPHDLPLIRHFSDKELVLMRSDWDGDETVCGFKCGPHFGHHALRYYPHDIGGGHMHPDAGTFQILAYGDRLIADDGYCWKLTEYQNTVLVNGIGQTGEDVPWFEGLQLRREQRGPRILRYESTGNNDYIIGDATAAYEPQAGLTKFLRHMLYVRPHCWIIVDELQTRDPAQCEVYFHSDYEFQPNGNQSYIAHGSRAALRLTSLWPQGIAGRAFMHPMKNPAGQVFQHLPALVLSNQEKADNILFITALEVLPLSETEWAMPELLCGSNDKLRLTVCMEGGPLRLNVEPDQPDAATPVLTFAG